MCACSRSLHASSPRAASRTHRDVVAPCSFPIRCHRTPPPVRSPPNELVTAHTCLMLCLHMCPECINLPLSSPYTGGLNHAMNISRSVHPCPPEICARIPTRTETLPTCERCVRTPAVSARTRSDTASTRYRYQWSGPRCARRRCSHAAHHQRTSVH